MFDLKDRNNVALLLDLKPGNLTRRHDGTWEVKQRSLNPDSDIEMINLGLDAFRELLIKRAALYNYHVWIVSAEVKNRGNGSRYYLVGFGVEAR
jgi:hypothetical protein